MQTARENRDLLGDSGSISTHVTTHTSSFPNYLHKRINAWHTSEFERDTVFTVPQGPAILAFPPCDRELWLQ